MFKYIKLLFLFKIQKNSMDLYFDIFLLMDFNVMYHISDKHG